MTICQYKIFISDLIHLTCTVHHITSNRKTDSNRCRIEWSGDDAQLVKQPQMGNSEVESFSKIHVPRLLPTSSLPGFTAVRDF